MSWAPSSTLEAVKFFLSEALPGPVATPEGVRVTTHCMYPSNGLVRVFVNGGVETFIVSDEGEAVGEVLAAGIDVNDVNKLARHLVLEQGLHIEAGIIRTPRIPGAALPVAIPLVANVARDVAHWFYQHKKVRRTRDFRRMLSDYLESAFDERLSRDEKIVGASNKPHRFANVLNFSNGRKLIIDAVAKDASSINSRVVANLDIRTNSNPLIDQRIVYDDSEGWSSADLNLLNVGAPAVPFSKAAMVIDRVAREVEAA